MTEQFTVGFIGAGNMGGALAQAVIRSIGAERVAVADKNAEVQRAFCLKHGCRPSTGEEIVKTCRFVFLGIKPQYLGGFAEEIREALKERREDMILVSMLAGTCIEKLREALDAGLPVIRIMPNTPVAVGEGMILYHPEGVPEEDVGAFEELMRFAGKTDRIPEKFIDAGCAISGCGPAFAYLIADAMADAGVALGLTKKQAVTYAAQTLLGSAKMILEGDRSPSDLKDAVCSPGGSTIAGVKAMEKNAVRYGVMEAVSAAYEKTKALQ